jgi:hypothetical protein
VRGELHFSPSTSNLPVELIGGPHITEPLMLTFDASVHYRAALPPEELLAAGLERYATA